MEKHSTFGSYIRALRMQNELTQAGLAKKLGVTDKAVSKWERDLSYPDMALYPKLADILGVTANDLLRASIGEGRPSRLLQIFGMTHDIRTPLHIILGCANLARVHSGSPEQLERYLESIRLSGEYLLQTVERLMQVTDQEQAGSGEQARPADVRELEEYLNQRADARKNALENYDFSGRRVLVAEDIQVNREILAEILKQTGAESFFAENGAACVSMMEEAPAGFYDLVLMDIMMPEMDGLEAARRIRAMADPRKAGIPIIAVSANVYEKERRAAHAVGMDGFVEKPVRIDRLLAMMDEVMK